MKKGVSVIVSYVLLILLTVSMAGMIYGFLQYRAKYREKIECPVGVSVYVENFSCNEEINLTLKNNGLWNISGINIIVYSDNKIVNTTRFLSQIGIEETKSFLVKRGNRLEILPFIKIKDRIIYCSDALIIYDISC